MGRCEAKIRVCDASIPLQPLDTLDAGGISEKIGVSSGAINREAPWGLSSQGRSAAACYATVLLSGHL